MRGMGYRIITAAIAAVSLLLLLFLFIFAEPLAEKLTDGRGQDISLSLNDAGESCLLLKMDARSFDGNGIFDPMEGVTAIDVDGSDIRYKVAVAYTTKGLIHNKKICYTLYDANRQKLTAACTLVLENYSGPSIAMPEIEEIDIEDLDELFQILRNGGMIKGNDGFGKDVTSDITYSYRLDEVSGEAELIFMLKNQFNDSCAETFKVQVNGLVTEF